MNGYIKDCELSHKRQKNGENDWDSFLPEIADSLGIGMEAVDTPLKEDKLNDLQYLIIGSRDIKAEAVTLKKWVEEGGVLILFAATGTEECTGFLKETIEKQTDDDFTTSAYVSLTPEYAASVYRNEKLKTLPVYSDCVHVEIDKNTEVLAWFHRPTLFGLDGSDKTEYPAICWKKAGKGIVYYFAFSLPKTLWVLQQGRPVDKDYDGDGYYRTGDGIVLTRAHDLMLPYADIHRAVLRDILSEVPQPFIYEIPADEEGNTPDFMLHYGGDDEGSDDYQMIASRVMKERNLPYHANLMLNKNGEFAVTREQFRELKENGTEPSIHFDFFAARKFYTREEFDRQLTKYIEAFGEVPKVSVNHVLMWNGWVDHERWCMERGIKADHTKIHKHLMPDYNPINTVGMAFGTTYPHFVYDDYSHGNEKMEFLDIPIGFFEPRVYPETEQQDKARIDNALEMAFMHKAALNIFVHPVYLATEPACLAALDYIKERIAQVGYKVIHVNNDFLCDWWYDRSEISVTEVKTGKKSCSFTAVSRRPFAVQMKNHTNTYYVNGEEKKARDMDRFAEGWKLYWIPAGTSAVMVERSI